MTASVTTLRAPTATAPVSLRPAPGCLLLLQPGTPSPPERIAPWHQWAPTPPPLLQLIIRTLRQISEIATGHRPPGDLARLRLTPATCAQVDAWLRRTPGSCRLSSIHTRAIATAHTISHVDVIAVVDRDDPPRRATLTGVLRRVEGRWMLDEVRCF